METKSQRLWDYLFELEINVPVMPLAQLAEQSCAHYNDRQSARERWDAREAMPASNPSFLERISVNYLCHRLSSYDQELARLFDKVSMREAYLELNEMVYQAIATA